MVILLLTDCSSLAPRKRALRKGRGMQLQPENNIAGCIMIITVYEVSLTVVSSRSKTIFNLEAEIASIVLR